MTRNKSLTSLLVAGFIGGLLVTAAPLANAWTRTIGYRGPILSWATTRAEIVFPSDTGWTGSPSGNAATTIYVDFSTSGGTAATNATLQACAYSYNGSGGGCGAATTSNYAANGVYDVSIAKWSGTGSSYDYFYIDIINNNANALQPMGVAIVG